MAFVYEELTENDQTTAIHNRLRDLENQHLALQIREESQIDGQPFSDADTSMMTSIEAAISNLRATLPADTAAPAPAE
jgi:hypothetical protein